MKNEFMREMAGHSMAYNAVDSGSIQIFYNIFNIYIEITYDLATASVHVIQKKMAFMVTCRNLNGTTEKKKWKFQNENVR